LRLYKTKIKDWCLALELAVWFCKHLNWRCRKFAFPNDGLLLNIALACKRLSLFAKFCEVGFGRDYNKGEEGLISMKMMDWGSIATMKLCLRRSV
jgi:hypothetical protein